MGFSKEARCELGEMMNMVNTVLRFSFEMFVKSTEEHVEDIRNLEEAIDEKEKELAKKDISNGFRTTSVRPKRGLCSRILCQDLRGWRIMPRILLLPTAILSRLRNTRQRPGRGNGFRMMKRKTLLIIICVMLIFVSSPVQASMPVPDLLPFGQLDLDEEPVQGAEGTEGGEPAAENGTPVDGGTQEDAEESAMEILEEDTIGSGMILIADKTAEDYALAYERAKNANWGYTNLGISNVSDNLNIRAIAAEDGRLVGKSPKDAACEVIDMDDTWAHIQSGEVDGYVSRDYLLTGVPAKFRAEELAVTVATVTTDSLKVRAEANTDSEVITLVPRGEELEVSAVEGDWVKVFLDDDEVYVSGEYVEVSAELGTAITMSGVALRAGNFRCARGYLSVCEGVFGQSLCMGRHQSDQGSGLLRLCFKRL